MPLQSKLSAIIDDSDGFDFKFAEGQWRTEDTWPVEPGPIVNWQYYEKGQHLPTSRDSASMGSSFTLDFNGTAVAFYGDVYKYTERAATVRIDGGAPQNIEIPSGSYMAWYQSPTLSEGRHTINVTGLVAAAVDFALVDIGLDTQWLAGKTVVIDDNTGMIGYSGRWAETGGSLQKSTSPNLPPSGPDNPMGGSVHRSSTVGDALSFNFAGGHVEIYGVFNWALPGTLQLSFSIDGESPDVRTFEALPSLSGNYLGYEEVANTLFFSRELKQGEHTMVVTITQCDSQEFIFDYATFQPRESTLSALPAPAPFHASDRVGNGKSSTGVIVGATVGAVAFLCASLFLIFWLRRRSQEKKSAAKKQTKAVVVDLKEEKTDKEFA